MDTNLPDKKIQNINELLGVELEMVAANGTKIPYLGFIEVKFQLAKSEGSEVLQVPMLVTPKPQLLPLIGFNVIQETVNEGSDKEASVSTINVMKETFQSSDETNMENLVHLIHETNEANTWFGSVRTIKKDFVPLKGQSTKIHCRANYIAAEPRTPVIFEPNTLLLPEGIEITESLFNLKRGSSHQLNLEVHNVTNQDIVLPRRTPLGSLQLVKSVTPIEVVRKDLPKNEPQNESSTKMSKDNSEHQSGNETVQNSSSNVNTNGDQGSAMTERQLQKVSLGDHLTEEQKQRIKQMLYEESESF